MKIEKLDIKNLYGYIDKKIEFNDDLTLLVGINGSGKTSILNIINWMIRPSIANLCVTEFKSIVINFSYKTIKYKATCVHYKNIFKYTLKKENYIYPPLIVRTTVHPSEIKNNELLKNNLLQEYSGLRPDKNEVETWDVLSKLPKPTVLGLDRNFSTEDSESLFVEETIKGKIIRKTHSSNVTPLKRVKEIINTEYRRRKNSLLKLTNNLKNVLMLSTFEGNITQESFKLKVKSKLDLKIIDIAETHIKEYFTKYENIFFTPKHQKIINNYFSILKKIINEYEKNKNNIEYKILYSLNVNQFVKINKLLKEFNKFEDSSNKEFRQLNLFLDLINHFFKDSAKKLLFKEDTAEITFNTYDKSGKVINEFRDINLFSSGEQQLLILFSYIAFNSQDGQIFIIDEPELSLHIKWQEDFLDYLEKITPKTTQLIFATHSPILAGKKENKTKVLFPYN